MKKKEMLFSTNRRRSTTQYLLNKKPIFLEPVKKFVSFLEGEISTPKLGYFEHHAIGIWNRTKSQLEGVAERAGITVRHFIKSYKIF